MVQRAFRAVIDDNTSTCGIHARMDEHHMHSAITLTWRTLLLGFRVNDDHIRDWRLGLIAFHA